ncbi:MAG: M3 family metallopeptidase, partial [Chloroflexota bacterium]
PTLARFELELHERVERGQALTAASMNALMTELFMEGYGEELDADKDRIGITWAEFPSHMYGNFYVWQYATGIAGAQALATRVLSEGPAAAEDYLKFLRAGSSMYPLDVLRLAGVDMTSPEPVEIAFGILSDTVERLAELTSKKDS